MITRTAFVAFATLAVQVPRAGAQELRGEVRLRGLPLPGAVVYLERTTDSTALTPPTRGRMDQRDLTFVPRVLIVPPGSIVEFPNSDPVMHNVFHPGEGEAAFDLGTYSSSESKALRFDRSGLFVILCHVHPEMVGYVAVVPTPWHTVTAEDGAFLIADLDSGEYRLHVWHRLAQDPALVVSVGSGAAVPLLVPVERRGRRGKTP